MHLDEVLHQLGEFGPYQRLRFFLICLFSVVSAWHALNMVFTGATPDFHCRFSQYNLTGTPLDNLTSVQLKALVIPPGAKCYQYNVTVVENVGLDYGLISATNGSTQQQTVSCLHGYEYSKENYIETLTSEFNLVCQNSFWMKTSKSVFFAGRLCGAVVFGQLSDRFGRRPMFFWGCLLLLVAGLLASVAPRVEVFLPAYFCQGAAHTGVFLVAFTLATELVGPKYRALAGFISQSFYSIGYMSLAGIAYFLRHWRHLEMAITVPVVLFALYWWFLPESIRWLLSHGEDIKAEAILTQAAKENGVTLSENVIQALKKNQSRNTDRKYYFKDLLNTWKMARLSLNIWFNWLVNSLVYYGLSLNTSNLAGNPYLNFCIAGAVEIPAYVLCILLLDRVGRRLPLVVSMCLGGVACILSGCIPAHSPGLEALTVVLAMIGKLGITASYGIIYLLAAEVFPTVTRNIGMGVSSMSARIGGIIAPLVLDLQGMPKSFPVILFGVLSILAGSLALLLPETMGKPLPQVPEDVDHGQSCDCFHRCKGRRKEADISMCLTPTAIVC